METKDLLDEIFFGCSFRGPVEEEIAQIIKTSSKSPLKESLLNILRLDKPTKPTMEHSKRLRVYLIWIAIIAAGLEPDDEILKSAIWIEMIHQASLIIDDIQDKGQERCGDKPAYIKYGENDALNLAFFLLGTAGDVELKKSYFGTKGKEIHNYKELKKEHIGNMVYGQHLDVNARKGGKLIKDYLNIVDGKTGALIDLSLHFGTMPYEYLYSENKSRILTKFSMILARLYQIIDDLKDIKNVRGGLEGARLDPSNIYFYLEKNHVKLSKLCKDLQKGLVRTHNELKKLGVINNDEMFKRVKILLNTSNSGKN